MYSITDDSHTYAAYMPGGFLRQLIRTAAVPDDMKYAAPFISTIYADGKYIVTWTCRSDTGDLQRGDAVIAVNGESISAFIDCSLQPRLHSARYGHEHLIFRPEKRSLHCNP